MRINELTSPYRELAEKRMLEYRGFIETKYDLMEAIFWQETKEGKLFWKDVNEGKTPKTPQSSLDELKEYGNAKPLPDAKEVKHPEPTKDDRLFTAAVAAMQGMIYSYTHENWAITANTMADISWNYAEALIAEGKKRNHL